jgi:hypothetical protein
MISAGLFTINGVSEPITVVTVHSSATMLSDAGLFTAGLKSICPGYVASIVCVPAESGVNVTEHEEEPLPLPVNVHELPGVKKPEPAETERFTVPVGSALPDVLVTVTVHVDSSLMQTGESQESEILVLSAAYPKNPTETSQESNRNAKYESKDQG